MNSHFKGATHDIRVFCAFLIFHELLIPATCNWCQMMLNIRFVYFMHLKVVLPSGKKLGEKTHFTQGEILYLIKKRLKCVSSLHITFFSDANTTFKCVMHTRNCMFCII